MRKIVTLLFLSLFLFVLPAHSQNFRSLGSPQAFSETNLKIRIKKYGAILGFQRGQYGLIQFGGEVKWKKVKLKNPRVWTAHGLVSYNISNNIMGYHFGTYTRKGRLALTYGGALLFYTDFNQEKFGFTPQIGYRIMFFHVKTGYNFIINRNVGDFNQINTFYFGVHMFLSQEMKMKFKRSKKKKK
jgi:hypothetical protein